jgi:hypothetical protein
VNKHKTDVLSSGAVDDDSESAYGSSSGDENDNPKKIGGKLKDSSNLEQPKVPSQFKSLFTGNKLEDIYAKLREEMSSEEEEEESEGERNEPEQVEDEK